MILLKEKGREKRRKSHLQAASFVPVFDQYFFSIPTHAPQKKEDIVR